MTSWPGRLENRADPNNMWGFWSSFPLNYLAVAPKIYKDAKSD